MPDALEQYNNYKEGAGSYAYGLTMDQRKVYSMAIDKRSDATDAKSCRDSELAIVRKNPLFPNHKVELSESAGSAFLHTRGTSQVDGRSIFGQHIHRYIFRDGLCAKVHVSSSIDENAISKELALAVKSMEIKLHNDEIVRSFHIPPKGTLRIAMPSHWGFQTSNPFGAPGRTVTIKTPDGHFQFMASAFLANSGKSGPEETATLRAAEASRDQAAPTAVQAQVDIQFLKGRTGEGHFVFVTDKTLVGKPHVPNNWKHMRQGMVKVGASFVVFTVFSNDEDSPDALRAMRALENLDFAPD